MNTLLNRRTILMTAALGAGTTLLQACGGGDDEPQRNIVEIAQSNPDLSILVEAVVAAGLAQNLSSGSLTVFAPTNAAFAALLTELGVTKDALLANKPLLTAVLSYHVLSSRVPRADVPVGKAITPLAGGFFKIEATGGLKVTDGRNRVSNITATDIQASNGVVHLLDRVLLPPTRTSWPPPQPCLISASWSKPWQQPGWCPRCRARARSPCSLPPTPHLPPCWPNWE